MVLYLLAVLVASAAAGIALTDPAATPVPAEWLAALPGGAVGRWLPASIVALLGVLVLGCVLPAIIRRLRLARAIAALNRLAQAEEHGTAATPETFLAALSASGLQRQAGQFAAGLTREGGGGGDLARWRSARDPGAAFASARRARATAAAAFGPVALALAALALAPLIAGGGPGAGGADRLAAPLLLAGLALGLFLVLRVLNFASLEAVTEIEALAGQLFPPPDQNAMLGRLSDLLRREGTARNAAIGGAGQAIGDTIEAALRELKTTLGSHDRRIAASVATAVQRATQPIAETISDVLLRVEAEREAQQQRLVQSVLTEFADRFHERFGGRIEEIGGVLAAMRGAADTLGEAIARAHQSLLRDAADLNEAASEALRHAVETAGARHGETMREASEQLRQLVAETSRTVERLGHDTQAALEAWGARSELATQQTAERAGHEIRKTAGAFVQLHTILETLSVSVLPAINKLVMTQERLRGAIEADAENGRSVAAAASELAEAARISREMVERQILFTRELAQLAPVLAATPSASRAAETPAPTAGLAQALDDLRIAANDELGALPHL